MMAPRLLGIALALLALLAGAQTAPAGQPTVAAASDSTTVVESTTAIEPTAAADTTAVDEDHWIPDAKEEQPVELTYLVPALKDAGYRVSAGKRQFQRRLAFSPGVGRLGDEELFALRGAFNPNSWLGYEVAFGHNPASSLHALLHTFSVILRYPLPWRVQPYATVGYGMLTVFPGKALNADPVTKNAMTAGGGLEIYVRDDVAIRGEMRSANVIGQEISKGGNITYSYREFTVGFAFYRSLAR